MRLTRQQRVGRQSRANPRRRTGMRRRRRAVSDVVATILLLALTVTLFAAIFAFVTSFPAPPAQNSNQFQASFTYASNQSYITNLNILHLAGPAVPGNGLIYLKSATFPTAPAFKNPIPVSWGIHNATPVWNLGQTWAWKFPTGQLPSAQDNITVYVVSNSQLIFSVVLPGQNIAVPPTIVAGGVTPTIPVLGSTFTVWAVIAGSPGANSVYVNLAGVPGLTATPQKMSLNSQGQWQLVVTSSLGLTTTNGTFYAFVNASNSKGPASGAILITIAAGTPFLTVSVAPSVQPAPGLVRVPETLQAIVTNSGPLTATMTSVTFWVNNSTTKASVVGPITGAISHATVNPFSSVTVLSSSKWLPTLASIYNLTARVLFSTGQAAVQWTNVTVGQAFSVSVAVSPAKVGASGTSTFAISLANFGSLAGTTANITIYTNKTGTTLLEGSFPLLTTNGVGNGAYVTPKGGSPVGAYSILTAAVSWTAPSSANIACTVTVFVILTNSQWTTAYTLSGTASVIG
jgi:Archaeal Type IV pilin, N-terminal